MLCIVLQITPAPTPRKSVSEDLDEFEVQLFASLQCCYLYLYYCCSNRDFGLRNFQLMSGKSFRIEERLKTQSGEENSSSDEEFSSPDCVFKRSSIRKDFPDIIVVVDDDDALLCSL